MSAKRIALLITGDASAERQATAVRLAERLLARGHRLTVYAHDDAVGLSSGSGDVATAIASLLRRGVHGGTLDWVIDEAAASRHASLDRQVAGVVPGDPADLWAFVRDADLVLSAGGA